MAAAVVAAAAAGRSPWPKPGLRAAGQLLWTPSWWPADGADDDAAVAEVSYAHRTTVTGAGAAIA